MRLPWIRFLAVLAAAAWPALAAAQPAPSWDEARKAIIADYAKQQPGDKVLEVTGPERSQVILIAVRYFGSVILERADKTRERNRVTVEYRLVGSRWDLAGVRVTESIALPDVDPPAKDEAQRLIAAAWQKANCEGYDIQSIALDADPRFQRELVSDRTKAKRWFVYRIRIDAVGTGKFRLSKDGVPYVNRTQNMLLWDPAGRSWSVDPRHVRCKGFTEKR